MSLDSALTLHLTPARAQTNPHTQVSLLFADSTSLAIASFISPYASDRALARSLHENHKGSSDGKGLPFLEIFVDASLDECERRDPKGLYKKARAGEIKGFTGVSPDAPYEKPTNPELRIDADTTSVEDAVKLIVELLQQRGIVSF